MAQGLVRYTNPKIAAAVDLVKQAQQRMDQIMDRLTVIYNINTNYADIAVEVDADAADMGDAGLKVWSNLSDALTALNTASDALSNMDKNVL